jgi:hypothetical protein
MNNLLNDSFLNGTTAVVVGQIGRVAATGKIELAQADTLAHLAGTVGIIRSGAIAATTNALEVATHGHQKVLLETGLTPVPGDVVWVSASVAGRGTNVQPVGPNIAFPIGTIKSVSQYTTKSTVGVDVLSLASVFAAAQAGSGAQGAQGPQGGTGGAQGPQGFQGGGAQGSQGGLGAQGAVGGGGGALAYGFFTHTGAHATIAIDAPFPFDANGPIHGGVARLAPSNDFEFVLPVIGVYDISWQMSVDEPGQTMLDLNDGAGYVLQTQTMAGRATGTNQITNRVLIATTTNNALIKIMNHSSSGAQMTLTPLPGGTSAGTTSLTIVRVA